MIEKVIKFTDLDGNDVEETHYFNITETEATELEMSKKGGMSTLLQKIVAEKDAQKIIGFMKELILLSYGERSEDGRSFTKSKKKTKAFKNSLAFNALFMELATDADKAAEFANGILPRKLVEAVNKTPSKGNKPKRA